MSVLDRKLFRGGVANFKHGGDLNIDHNSGKLKTSTAAAGIAAGMKAFDPFIEPFVERMFPKRSESDLRSEAKSIYDTDFSAQRNLLEQQKKEDFASSLISFGARLASGRGKSLDIIAGAAQATVPELSAMRRATRADEIELVGQEQKGKKQIAQYVLTKQQENAVNKANAYSTFVMSNLDFVQSIAKSKTQKDLDMETSFVDQLNIETGNVEKITMQDKLDDLLLPREERIYQEDDTFDIPMLVFDKTLGYNRYFGTKNEFNSLNDKKPGRFDKARDLDGEPVQKMLFATYRDYQTNETVDRPVRQLKSGDYQIMKMKQDGTGPELQANGQPIWIPAGTSAQGIVPRQDVETASQDIGTVKMQLEIFSGIQQFDASLSAVDTVMKNLSDDKTRAGIVGSIREKIKIGEGMITDFLQAKQSNTDAIVSDVQKDVLDSQYGESFQNELFNPESDFNEGFFAITYNRDFDPAFAQNRVLVNAIAYSVARARKKTGRLNLDDVRNARDSLQLSGFTSADTVIVGLETIRNELYQANEDLKVQFEFVGGEYPESYVGNVPLNADNFPSVTFNEKGKFELVMPEAEL